MKIKKIIIFQSSDNVINVDFYIKENKLHKNIDAYKLFLRYKINEQPWNIKNVIENNLFFSISQIDDKAYLFNIDKDF